MAAGKASSTKGLVTELAPCKSCPGWEKWGRIPKKHENIVEIGNDKLASDATATNHTSPRSAATGSPRREESASEVPTTADPNSPRSAMTETPKFTPRMTPPGSPRAASSMTVKPLQLTSNRRNSRVSFVENMGLDTADSDEDMDGLGIQSFEDILRDSMVSTFAMTPRVQACGDSTIAAVVDLVEEDEDSDDDSEDCGDIYDEYDFDHTKISEMIQAGADREKLTTAVEDAMAAALERKLKAKATAPVKQVISSENPYATGTVLPGETIYDLSGSMTPGRMTPTNGAGVVDVDAQTVAERMQQALQSASLRRRRSSAARKGVDLDVISEAKRMAALRRRASLAARAGPGSESGDVQDTISHAMQNANRRHRQSIAKASEVLEDADFGANMGVGEVTTKMNMIEVAMAEARRRHRQSIAKAVSQLQEPPALNVCANVFTPSSMTSSGWQQSQGLDASAEVFVPPFTPSYASDCQQNAGFSGDWKQQQQQQESVWPMPVQCQPGQQESWNGQCQQSWECASSPFQARINQAVSSAYQSHCYTEQQTYRDYNGTCAQYVPGYQSPPQQNYAPVSGNVYYVPVVQDSCPNPQYNQRNFGQDGFNFQSATVQGACCGTGNYHDQNGWSQSGNAEYNHQGVSIVVNNDVGMNNQFNQQAPSCNQYYQEGYSQGAPQCTPDVWGGAEMSACGGYSSY